jgi:hypothetical protein
LALPLAGVPVFTWLQGMRSGVIGCIFMGLSIILTKNFLIARLPDFLLLLVLGCVGLAVYVAIIRFSLSAEDSKFANSVSRILPNRLGLLFRLVLGINLSEALGGGVPGKILA